MDLSVVHRIQEMSKTASKDTSRLMDEKINPFDLKSVLDSELSEEWLLWLPETIRGSVSISQINMEKAMAIQSVMTNPDTQNDQDAFENCCTAFNNDIPVWGVIEPLSEEELCWGCMVIRALNPLFVAGDRVLAYCMACMEQDGLIWNPWLDVSIISDHMRDFRFLTQVENTVKSKWNIIKHMPIERLSQVEFQDNDEVEQQLEKLVKIRIYIEAMLQ